MTDDRLARWERAVESYLTVLAEVARLEAIPDHADPMLVAMAGALERHSDALAALLDVTPPNLHAFGFKLAAAPHMIELDRFAATTLPRLVEDWQRLLGP